MLAPLKPAAFKKIVFGYYRKSGRHDLPWRPPSLKLRKGKEDEYAYWILVSEIMLQQTQVERVIPFYRAFIRKFPTVKKLAAAPLSEVLKMWQGLGYNRRAKMLHEAAKMVAREYDGKLPATAEALQRLPGIGPYTTRAVTAFAYNADGIFIETNIRTVVLYHFFTGKDGVADSELLPILEKTFPKGRAREWYTALMDYGASLKRTGIRLNARSRGYTKQSTFKGSSREARGAILRALTVSERTATFLVNIFGHERKGQMTAQLVKLYSEGMIERKAGKYHLPS